MTERMKRTEELVKAVCVELGIAMIGEASLFVFALNDIDINDTDAIKRAAVNAMEDALNYPPDFSAIPLEDGMGGFVLMNHGRLWQAVLPEELELSEDGRMTINCSMSARAELLQACEKGEVIDIFTV